MKKLLLLFLLTSVYTLNGQNAAELIRQIQKDYTFINEEIIPKSAKIKIVRTWDHPMLFLVEDEIAGAKFDSAQISGERERYEFYFYRDDTDKNWKLTRLAHYSSFADGFGVWRDETIYYVSDQKLIFSYRVHIDEFYEEGEQDLEDYVRRGRNEERFYYADGRLIQRLYKEVAQDNKSLSSLRELIGRTPSEEIAITNAASYYEHAKEQINELLKNWGHGAELLK